MLRLRQFWPLHLLLWSVSVNFTGLNVCSDVILVPGWPHATHKRIIALGANYLSHFKLSTLNVHWQVLLVQSLIGGNAVQSSSSCWQVHSSATEKLIWLQVHVPNETAENSETLRFWIFVLNYVNSLLKARVIASGKARRRLFNCYTYFVAEQWQLSPAIILVSIARDLA